MSEPASTGIVSKLAGLNPFKKSKGRVDEDDVGDEISSGTVAGGGRGSRQSDITKDQLRVSHALRSFLSHEGILDNPGLDSDQPTEALRYFLSKSHIKVPSYVTDRSHPLPEYFISSSHNTYLSAHQLFGTSSAASYETVLKTGCQCIEIDAWDNDDDPEEPKVTHGYTLVSHISFRSVCEAVRDSVDKEAANAPNTPGYRPAPIFISLENHCDSHGQSRLTQIMKEVLGDRLLSKAVRHEGHQEQEDPSKHVCLEDLGSKVAVIVEYHVPNEVDDSSSSSSSSSEDEEEKQERLAYKEKKKQTASQTIIPELADLGLYAQSVKPPDDSWFEEGGLKNSPHHHLINVSETGLMSKMPANNDKITNHNAKHLMRVFPKRYSYLIAKSQSSSILGIGAQICALNWQTFGASVQLNEALFNGTDGFVLKPAALRGGTVPPGDKKLRVRIAGATDLPLPADREGGEDVKPYVTCSLVHPNDYAGDPPKQKTKPYKPHKLGFLHKGDNPPPTDPIWDETLEWTYKANDLVFLRILIKSDDSFAKNPIFAVATVRLLYVVPGWSFIRVLDLKGQETKCTLLVNFQIEDV